MKLYTIPFFENYYITKSAQVFDSDGKELTSLTLDSEKYIALTKINYIHIIRLKKLMGSTFYGMSDLSITMKTPDDYSIDSIQHDVSSIRYVDKDIVISGITFKETEFKNYFI